MKIQVADYGKVYERLPLGSNQLRLMKIRPATSLTDQVTASLLVGAFDDDSIPSDALSYTWGDLPDNDTILVNGLSMNVNKGFLAALRHLRLCDQEVTLWVDSIHINHDNVPERNAQVARMCAIYRRANQVRIWLGESSPDSPKAIKLANDCAKIRTAITL